MLSPEPASPRAQSSSKDKEPPEPLLSEAPETLGKFALTILTSELGEFDALTAVSTVCITLTDGSGKEVSKTGERPAATTIQWDVTFTVSITSFTPVMEIHLIRTSQDLLTNQLARKTLGSSPIEVLTTEDIVKGEASDQFQVNITGKGKKKPVGRLSLGFTYRALPNPYSGLDTLLLSPDQALIKTLLALNTGDGPAGALIRYYAYQVKVFDLVHLAIQTELNRTNELPQLFRGASLATQVMSEFLQLHGHSFLKELLKPLVLKVLQKSPDVELDPSKLTKPRDEKETRSVEKRLTEYCTTFLKHIASGFSSCPAAIREVATIVQIEAEKKFPGKSQVALASLLFLRFLCPAIVVTDQICPDVEPTPAARRALILITKVLQNLANDVPFGDKEGFMVSLNPYVQSNKTYAAELYKKVMHNKKAVYDPARYRRRVPRKAYEAIFKFAADSKLIPEELITNINEHVAKDAPHATPSGTPPDGNSQKSGKGSDEALHLSLKKSGEPVLEHNAPSNSDLDSSTSSIAAPGAATTPVLSGTPASPSALEKAAAEERKDSPSRLDSPQRKKNSSKSKEAVKPLLSP